MTKMYEGAPGWAAWLLTEALIDKLIERGVMTKAEAAEVEQMSLKICNELSEAETAEGARARWDAASVIIQMAVQRRLRHSSSIGGQ